MYVSQYSFSCKGLVSSIATTMNTPLLLGGPSSVRPKPLIPIYSRKLIPKLGRLVLDHWSLHVLHVGC